jgi:hypothetical protein
MKTNSPLEFSIKQVLLALIKGHTPDRESAEMVKKKGLSSIQLVDRSDLKKLLVFWLNTVHIRQLNNEYPAVSLSFGNSELLTQICLSSYDNLERMPIEDGAYCYRRNLNLVYLNGYPYRFSDIFPEVVKTYTSADGYPIFTLIRDVYVDEDIDDFSDDLIDFDNIDLCSIIDSFYESGEVISRNDLDVEDDEKFTIFYQIKGIKYYMLPKSLTESEYRKLSSPNSLEEADETIAWLISHHSLDEMRYFSIFKKWPEHPLDLDTLCSHKDFKESRSKITLSTSNVQQEEDYIISYPSNEPRYIKEFGYADDMENYPDWQEKLMTSLSCDEFINVASSFVRLTYFCNFPDSDSEFFMESSGWNPYLFYDIWMAKYSIYILA